MLAVILAAGFAGCSRDEANSPLVIQTLSPANSPEFQVLSKVVEAFHVENPDVQIILKAERLNLDYVMRSIIARNCADVIELADSEVGFLAVPQRAALASLTAECVSLAPEINQRAWSLSIFENNIYALPWAAQPLLLLYNREAFRAAGLPDDAPPATWDDMIRIATALTRDTDGDGTIDQFGFALAAKRSAVLGRKLALFLSMLEVPLLDIRDQRWAFNLDRRETHGVVQFLLALQKCAPPECIVTDDERALEQFASGRAAMVFTGPAGATSVHSIADIGVAPIPSPRGMDTVSEPAFRFFALPAFLQGARRDNAIRFLKFVSGRDGQRIVSRGTEGVYPLVPVRRRMLQDHWYADRPIFREYVLALQKAPNVRHYYPAFIWEPKYSTQWIGSIHNLMLHSQVDVTDMCEVAEAKGNQALSCLYTDIGHPSTTMILGMLLVGGVIFVSVAYIVSQR